MNFYFYEIVQCGTKMLKLHFIKLEFQAVKNGLSFADFVLHIIKITINSIAHTEVTAFNRNKRNNVMG